jgi:tRNA U34 2-thiouridine synthase MnmA/TrmU
MSGGIDSSVVGILLTEQGYDVYGGNLQNIRFGAG